MVHYMTVRVSICASVVHVYLYVVEVNLTTIQE